MARRKPSERRNFKEEDMELNLVPMMNLVSILIPALLISVVFVEIAVINVSAPSIGAPSDGPPPDKPEKPPLNLTVAVTDKGFTLAGAGGVLPGAEAADGGGGATIPIVERKVSCSKYVDTRPPPRAKNGDRAPCVSADVDMAFWVYDNKQLTARLTEIKDAFPDERRLIISAEAETEYEVITDVMDASRETKVAGGDIRTLFDEVVIGAMR